jgi:hypothetical protein
MEKTYILLRSNKQQGPFTLAQLAKMDLRPEDLVNVQGGIVGWQYAEEIDVLKPYLSGYLAPAAPVVSTPSIPVAATSPVPPTNTSAVPVTSTVEKSKTSEPEVTQPIEAHVPKVEQQVPKVEESIPDVDQSIPKAAGVFASYPTGTELSPSGLELKSASSIPAQSATQPSVIKPASISTPKSKPVTEAVPLKEKTAIKRESIRTQSPSVVPRKKVKPAVVLTSLLALGILAFGVGQFATGKAKNVSSRNESGNTNLAATESNDTPVEDNRTTLQQELPLSKPTDEADPSLPVDKPSSSATSVQVDNNRSEKKVVAAAPDSQQDVVGSVPKPEVIEPAKPATKESAKASPDLTEQIYLKSNFINNELGEGVFDLNISMDNKSDKLLKTVAVNIFFLDNDGKTLNKQTIYFSNVKPGETIARPASQHKLATRVRCELGLISSEGLLYYAN